MIRRILSANKSISAKLKSRFPGIFRGEDGHAEINGRIRRDLRALSARTVLECGGIDRPLLQKSEIETYIGLDIEDRPRCHDVYHHFLVQSVEAPIAVTADIVISTTLLEHVPDTEAAFQQIHGALREGGTTHHYVGPSLQRKLIGLFRPEAADVSGYPVFFDNCSPSALERILVRTGFRDIDIKPFYHATEYFDFFAPLFLCVGVFEKTCERFNIRLFAAGVVVSAKR
jgi:SAM-dependent methyltransferase